MLANYASQCMSKSIEGYNERTAIFTALLREARASVRMTDGGEFVGIWSLGHGERQQDASEFGGCRFRKRVLGIPHSHFRVNFKFRIPRFERMAISVGLGD